MTTPVSGFGGGDYELLSLGSGQLSSVPFLGYRLRESHLDTADTEPYIRAPQRWIAVAGSTALIDVPTFDRYQPFAQLLDQDSTSELITSIHEALASFPCDGVNRDMLARSTLTALVRGRDFQALVWDYAVRICATGPTATALKLLFADFSPQSRANTVQGRPGLLKTALDVFYPEIRQRYIPKEAEYIATAHREQAGASHRRLAALAAKRKPAPATSPAPSPATDPAPGPDGSSDVK
ncbi:hypothetical protein [[Mycobacterium] crassicus]|uniref:Cytochrome P450 n=1 Tax=[Mycobacterium] crassicus TaxID=2872309 RepID=A0ABU5XNK2_9MYCO|nr:hypothetical protein [Mycolicibacter sp. MYC098]MEB3023564.1 hypothetical protein [Mycolicibacter sp. MYC098]